MTELSQELNARKEIERQLRLTNAELNLEVEKHKLSQLILEESLHVLSLFSEISSQIIEQGEVLDLDEVLKKIGQRLKLNKIFLLRFTNTIESYKEWISDDSHKTSVSIENQDDLTQLMNWVYNKESFSGYAINLPNYFKLICCPTDRRLCIRCNLILIPLIIDKKPWGIMGYAKNSDGCCAELTQKTMINLSKLLSILIRDQEENTRLSTIIDEKIKEFESYIKKG